MLFSRLVFISSCANTVNQCQLSACIVHGRLYRCFVLRLVCFLEAINLLAVARTLAVYTRSTHVLDSPAAKLSTLLLGRNVRVTCRTACRLLFMYYMMPSLIFHIHVCTGWPKKLARFCARHNFVKY